jgi:hypothetical protein
MPRFAALFLFLALAVRLDAQAWEYVIGGDSNPCLYILACTQPVIEWHPNGPVQYGVAGNDLVPGPGAHLYTVERGPTVRLVEVTRNGPNRLIYARSDQNDISVVVDRSGTFYVLTSGAGPVYRILTIGSNGALLDEQVLPFSAGGPIDLAADQCTLFLPDVGGVIHRFNVCTGTALPDFGVIPNAQDLHILPDGGVIAAVGETIATYAPNGTLRRTYTVPVQFGGGPTALGLERTGTVLVAIGEEGYGRVYRLELTSGAFTPLFTDEEEGSIINGPESIVPFDGWTAAIGPLVPAAGNPTAPVPTASEWALIALGAVLAGVALRRLG